MFSAVIHTIII